MSTTAADFEKMIAGMEPYRSGPKVGSAEWLRGIPEPLRQWYEQGMEDVFGAQAVPHKGRAITSTFKIPMKDGNQVTWAQRYDDMRWRMTAFPLHCPGLTTGQRLDNALQNLFW